MAISTSSYFSNSIIGTPQVGADIDIYETNTSPKYAVGFGFTRADGNKYRYSHFGAAAVTGKLYSKDVSATEQLYIDSARMVTLVANYVQIPGETLGPNVVGSRYIQVTLTVTKDQYAGGYVSITSGTGIGFQYRIRGCTATGDPNSADAYLELYDPLVVAVDSNSGLSIAGLPYSDLLITDNSDDRLSAGVPVTNNSNASYGWVQTYGTATILSAATLAQTGQTIYNSTNTDGAVSGPGILLATSTHETLQRIGYCIQPASAGYYALCFLELE